MMRVLLVLFFAGIFAACGSPSTSIQSVNTTEIVAPSATPFPMADGLFTGNPIDFLLTEEELDGLYMRQDMGTESPNSRVIELRPDGAAYVEATGRLNGWQIQFNRVGQVSGPSYLVQVVNIYDNLDGPSLTLSRDWHSDVWDRIDSGELTLLPSIPGLDPEHLVWQDDTGTIGVEIAYRNLYLFFTGPSDGSDNYDFFADLALTHIDWIRANEP